MTKKYKLVLAGLFVLFCAGFFFYAVEQDQAVAPKTTVSGRAITPVNKGAYYMKLDGNQVVIYRSDHSIFEYTDLNREILPKPLQQELKAGKYFKNEAELYEFLETYTS